MRRLLVKWVLVIFIAMVVSVVLVRFFIVGSRVHRTQIELSDSMVLAATLLADQAAERNPDEWGSWLASLSDRAGVQVSVQEPVAGSRDSEVQTSGMGKPHASYSRGQVLVKMPLKGGGTLIARFDDRFSLRPEGWMLLVPVVVLFTVSVFAAVLLLLPTVRRLDRLQEATAAIGTGQLETRVPVGDQDAIGELERHFNEMADKICSLFDGQRQLTQAVAHEIRTPIARIRWAQEMVATATDADDRARRLAVVDDQLEDLDELISELLVFHRYDQGTATLQRRPISVAPVVREVIEQLEILRTSLDIQLRGDDQERIVLAHPRSFERVLRNLIGNAVRHARGRVRIEIQDRPGVVVIGVLDDGPGIPNDDRERIFEPFARVDSSRNRASGGVGLGLAIARRIMDAHGGTISVTEAEGGGARFTSIWPSAGGSPRNPGEEPRPPSRVEP